MIYYGILILLFWVFRVSFTVNLRFSSKKNILWDILLRNMSYENFDFYIQEICWLWTEKYQKKVDTSLKHYYLSKETFTLSSYNFRFCFVLFCNARILCCFHFLLYFLLIWFLLFICPSLSSLKYWYFIYLFVLFVCLFIYLCT